MALAEIMGSREEWEDAKMIYSRALYVSTDSAHGLTLSTAFYTTKAGATESGVTGRLPIKVKMDPEVLPGLNHFAVLYAAFKAYA